MEIDMEFISSDALRDMDEKKKIDFIIRRIKKGKIIVIEEGLSSSEEAKLIEETMKQIDEKFPGIEISSLRDGGSEGIRDKLIRLLGGRTSGLTVIGPSRLVKKIRRGRHKIMLKAEKR
ncbi:MAG: DUF2073 domain-containing protein [Candidatus Altiarchaeales archaeon]|nr:MAG: DUF2073 domain-containing protein [Candidatus Altiarchaeales archaeon]RLI93641.1 MAG: DUF2073 domain-containing protein [Candidatus Altiarchaeales archaeon]HDO81862.1 DUF2073 domain-containing protein [Candidatus Altiarchaeales archaeon]HEX54511.1 DUF2073 domain-containing protein [Candidatus Altiarchaeales archaeon]